MRVHLEDVLGPFVRQVGKEKLHFCQLCPGKAPKLYVNTETGRWICHRCGHTGRMAAEGTCFEYEPASLSDVQTLAILPSVHLSYLQDALSQRSILLANVREAKAFTITSHIPNTVSLPLTLNECLVGYQTYDPDGNPRYQTFGQKGICYNGKPPEPGETWYLFEGMFDYLSMVQVAFLHGKAAEEIRYAFTAGNQLTRYHLAELARIRPGSLYLCWDSDKPGAALKAWARAKLICPTFLKLPPAPCKDWDEAAHCAGDDTWRTFHARP